MRTGPQKFTSICFMASSSLIASTSPLSAYPALLTTTSTRPNCFLICWNAALIASLDKMSNSSTIRVSGEWADTREARPLAFRVVATTRSPAARTSSTKLWPRPDEVPVTSNTISQLRGRNQGGILTKPDSRSISRGHRCFGLEILEWKS
jgi:hypothetical protein